MNHVAPSKLLNESGFNGAKQRSGAAVADKQLFIVRHTSIHPPVRRLRDSREKLLHCRTCGTRWHHKCRSSCMPCHMTTERHRGDPKGRAFGATWHTAAVKIVAWSSKRLAGRSRRKIKTKTGRGIVALLGSTVELFVWARLVGKKMKIGTIDGTARFLAKQNKGPDVVAWQRKKKKRFAAQHLSQLPESIGN